MKVTESDLRKFYSGLILPTGPAFYDADGRWRFSLATDLDGTICMFSKDTKVESCYRPWWLIHGLYFTYIPDGQVITGSDSMVERNGVKIYWRNTLWSGDSHV